MTMTTRAQSRRLAKKHGSGKKLQYSSNEELPIESPRSPGSSKIDDANHRSLSSRLSSLSLYCPPEKQESHQISDKLSISSSSKCAQKRRAAKISTPVVRMTDEQYKRYIVEYDKGGFDVPYYPEVTTEMIRPAEGSWGETPEDIISYARKAIDYYKTNVDKNANPKFVCVVKANYLVVGGSVRYYITFAATDNGQPGTYQAMVSVFFGNEEVLVRSCAFKPPTDVAA